MPFYTDQVLPRLTDVLLGRAMEETRSRVCAGLSGEVLELGFGSGRNLPHLPAGVSRVLAVEPAATGRKLAARRITETGKAVVFVGEDARDIGLSDDSVDHALVTWALCTIPEVDRALAEVHRVLRPGGTLHFVEHGLSPNARVARWQNRCTPLWGKAFGGCHLDRPIDQLVRRSGLILESIRTYNMSSRAGPADGPAPAGRAMRAIGAASELAGFAYEGVAVKAA